MSENPFKQLEPNSSAKMVLIAFQFLADPKF